MHGKALPFIDLVPGRSLIWLRLALFCYGSAAIFPFFSSLGPAAVFLWPVLVVHFTDQLRREYWRTHPESVSGLRLNQGRWQLKLHGGVWREASPVGVKTVAVPCTLLVFECEGKKYPVLLFQDAIDPEAFRRLRVWLYFRG